MRSFLVAIKDPAGDPDALLRKLDKEIFPDTYEYIKGKVWLVAARMRTATCGDLLEALAPEEMLDEGPWPLLFVSEIGQYNGIADPTLWQKLEAWESADV